MSARYMLRAVLIAIVILTVSRPAPAETIDTAVKQIYTGIAVVAVAIGVLIIVLIVHHKNKGGKAITGCLTSGSNGIIVNNEKDQHVYELSGDPVGVKPGERVTFHGRVRPQNGKTFIFEVHGSGVELGPCQP